MNRSVKVWAFLGVLLFAALAIAALPIPTPGASGTVLVSNGAGKTPTWGRAGAAGATGWLTALDCDWTAQGTHTLSPDGQYTYCGVAWNLYNSASASTSWATSASGLTIYSGSTGTGTPTISAGGDPTLWTQIGLAVPNWTLDMPIRFTMSIVTWTDSAYFGGPFMAWNSTGPDAGCNVQSQQLGCWNFFSYKYSKSTNSGTEGIWQSYPVTTYAYPGTVDANAIHLTSGLCLRQVWRAGLGGGTQSLYATAPYAAGAYPTTWAGSAAYAVMDDSNFSATPTVQVSTLQFGALVGSSGGAAGAAGWIASIGITDSHTHENATAVINRFTIEYQIN